MIVTAMQSARSALRRYGLSLRVTIHECCDRRIHLLGDLAFRWRFRYTPNDLSHFAAGAHLDELLGGQLRGRAS